MALDNQIQKNEHGLMSMLYLLAGKSSMFFAILGGLVLYALALTVTASVVMRATGIGGISGDVELVKIACGYAACLFLPLCQFRKGHVTVDLFSNMFPQSIQNFLEVLWEIIFALFWLLLAWRLFLGGMEIYEYEDRTQLLEIPVWIVYAPAVLGTVLSAMVALLLSHKTFTNNKLAARVE